MALIISGGLGFLVWWDLYRVAKGRLGCEKLDYRPNEDMLFPCLDHFSELISGLSQIQPGALEEWLAESDPSDPVMSGFPRCSRHQTLLSIFGCHICNNL